PGAGPSHRPGAIRAGGRPDGPPRRRRGGSPRASRRQPWVGRASALDGAEELEEEAPVDRPVGAGDVGLGLRLFLNLFGGGGQADGVGGPGRQRLELAGDLGFVLLVVLPAYLVVDVRGPVG